MKIGARMLKTAFAIFLSLTIPIITGYNELAVLSGLAVVASVKPSVKRSYITFRERILANLIGGVVAYFFATYLGTTPLYIAIASLALIAVLHQLSLDKVITLATMTLIIIMVESSSNVVYVAITRVSATILGVVIAFFVNTFLCPPKYDYRFFELTKQVVDETTRYTRIALRKNMQFGLMKSDLATVRSKINLMKTYFNYINEGELVTFFNKHEKSLARLLVVYKHYIIASEKAYNLVVILHRSENIFNNYPEHFRILIRERLEVLMSAHEQILLKWNGRVLPEEVNFLKHKSDLRKEFIDSFFSEASLESYMEGDYGDSNAVLKMMSGILEYEESLRNLNSVISNYIKYHKDETKVLEENISK